MSLASAAAWPRLTRSLYLVASAMFLVTVGIGIVNGLDLVDFSPPEMRNTLLTHVHSGTLGWISLAIAGSAFWLARAGERRLAITLGVVTPIYVAAFYTGNYPARAGVGALLLLAILWLLAWAWQAFAARRSLPMLSVALGITSFALGSIIGVAIQIQGAIGSTFLPAGGDAIGAHAGTMVFSYLVLTAMGLLEWRLLGTTGLPRAGVVQLTLLFVGGLILMTALLFLGTDAVQAIAGIYLLIEIVAVAIFVVRLLPTALRVPWLAAAPTRHFGLATIYVPIAVAIFLYIVALFASSGDFSSIPLGVLVASDHSVFIGVITNLVLGLALTLSADRAERWPWANQVIFWVVNIGLVIFLAGLIGNSPEIKRIGAPIMGTGILIALATIALRLGSSDLSAAGEGVEPGAGEVAPASVAMPS